MSKVYVLWQAIIALEDAAYEHGYAIGSRYSPSASCDKALSDLLVAREGLAALLGPIPWDGGEASPETLARQKEEQAKDRARP